MKKLVPHTMTLLVLGLSLGAMSLSWADTTLAYDFNTTNQLADNFNKGTTAGSGSGSLTNASSGGLSGSGSLAIPSGVGNDSFLYTTKSSVSNFSTLTISIYFQAKASTLTAGLALNLGLVDVSPATTTTPTSSVGIPDAASGNSLVVSLRNNGGTSDMTYNLSAYSNAAGLSGTSTSVTLTAGNWYQLQAVYVFDGSGNYTLTGAIYSASSDGTLGSSLTSKSWSGANAGLVDGEVYGLISSQNGDRKGLGPNLDNFSMSAVPEPSSLTLLGLSLLGVGIVTRRLRFR